ncbi:hypothetical protein BDV96DRAFT_344129 [Lophiotrema nucula]|uniref:Uncharacterized protein n=1 Tax=Lophiotrema nucula TaxID=690887 RepID=A0A6A5ZK39_9PLEO|nr:hypothetical protein BDV96DRAFT_344129 [Lophiotrema nucula]
MVVSDGGSGVDGDTGTGQDRTGQDTGLRREEGPEDVNVGEEPCCFCWAGLAPTPLIGCCSQAIATATGAGALVTINIKIKISGRRVCLSVCPQLPALVHSQPARPLSQRFTRQPESHKTTPHQPPIFLETTHSFSRCYRSASGLVVALAVLAFYRPCRADIPRSGLHTGSSLIQHHML